MKTVVICVVILALAFIALMEYPARRARRTPAPIIDAYRTQVAKPVAKPFAPPNASTVAEPTPPSSVVTAQTLVEFPKLYEHQRIQLVGWQYALVESAKSQTVSLPPDCKLVLNLPGLAAGCASTIPKGLLNPFGAVTEQDANLYCTVGWASHAGFLLTQCELTRSDERRMQEREYELETGKSLQ